MKRFEFPLESVLRLRRFHEAEARQALQEAVLARNAAEEALNLTRRRIADATERLTGQVTQMSPVEVSNAWRDLDYLEQVALKQAAELAELESVVAIRRESYVAAQRDRKPLDRLKEEMKRDYDKEIDRADQAICDELAVIGHSRRGREP